MSGLEPEDAKGLELLADLDDEERAAVAAEMEALEVDAGTCLFEEGEESDALYLVVRGGVRVASASARESCELGPGSAFGGVALVAAGPRKVRAETTSRCTLGRLPRDAYERLRADEPRVACHLLEAVVREVARLGREALDGAATDGGVDPVHSDE